MLKLALTKRGAFGDADPMPTRSPPNDTELSNNEREATIRRDQRWKGTEWSGVVHVT
jgi:hypothetical protein